MGVSGRPVRLHSVGLKILSAHKARVGSIPTPGIPIQTSKSAPRRARAREKSTNGADRTIGARGDTRIWAAAFIASQVYSRDLNEASPVSSVQTDGGLHRRVQDEE